MGNMQFSDVQIINLSLLITVRDSIKQDRIAACCKFGLCEAQARLLESLSIDQILILVANLGHECLFLPRQDMVSLLTLPLPLAGAVMAVHPPHHAPYAPQPAVVQC
ncbi:flagellar transcriptional regulator FlhD [Noviherbaspirillum sedimenti]|nr:flagellar transcriptional regulator FlhD [Noviherbaspirillum sedimenti]